MAEWEDESYRERSRHHRGHRGGLPPHEVYQQHYYPRFFPSYQGDPCSMSQPSSEYYTIGSVRSNRSGTSGTSHFKAYSNTLYDNPPYIGYSNSSKSSGRYRLPPDSDSGDFGGSSKAARRRCVVIAFVAGLVFLLAAGLAIGIYFGVVDKADPYETRPTPAPVTVMTLEGSLTIDRDYDPALDNPSTAEYQQLATEIETEMDASVAQTDLYNQYIGTTILGFRTGSVKADFLTRWKIDMEVPVTLEKLKEGIRKSSTPLAASIDVGSVQAQQVTNRGSVLLGEACQGNTDCLATNAKCASATCGCQDDYYQKSGTVAKKGGFCASIAIEGGCSDDGHCLNSIQAKCQDSKCICDVTTQFEREDKCFLRPGLGQACENTEQCLVSTFADCIDSTCGCAPGIKYQASGKCWPKSGLEGPCSNRDQCQDATNADCIEQKCRCEPTTQYLQNGVCFQKYSLGGACFNSIQCLDSTSATCIDSKCTCEPSTKYKGNDRCLAKSSLGGSCSDNGHCLDEINAECLESKCACGSSTLEENGKCVQVTSTSTTTSTTTKTTTVSTSASTATSTTTQTSTSVATESSSTSPSSSTTRGTSTSTEGSYTSPSTTTTQRTSSSTEGTSTSPSTTTTQRTSSSTEGTSTSPSTTTTQRPSTSTEGSSTSPSTTTTQRTSSSTESSSTSPSTTTTQRTSSSTESTSARTTVTPSSTTSEPTTSTTTIPTTTAPYVDTKIVVDARLVSSDPFVPELADMGSPEAQAKAAEIEGPMNVKLASESATFKVEKFEEGSTAYLCKSEFTKPAGEIMSSAEEYAALQREKEENLKKNIDQLIEETSADETAPPGLQQLDKSKTETTVVQAPGCRNHLTIIRHAAQPLCSDIVSYIMDNMDRPSQETCFDFRTLLFCVALEHAYSGEECDNWNAGLRATFESNSAVLRREQMSDIRSYQCLPGNLFSFALIGDLVQPDNRCGDVNSMVVASRFRCKDTLKKMEHDEDPCQTAKALADCVHGVLCSDTTDGSPSPELEMLVEYQYEAFTGIDWFPTLEQCPFCLPANIEFILKNNCIAPLEHEYAVNNLPRFLQFSVGCIEFHTSGWNLEGDLKCSLPEITAMMTEEPDRFFVDFVPYPFTSTDQVLTYLNLVEEPLGPDSGGNPCGHHGAIAYVLMFEATPHWDTPSADTSEMDICRGMWGRTQSVADALGCQFKDITDAFEDPGTSNYQSIPDTIGEMGYPNADLLPTCSRQYHENPDMCDSYVHRWWSTIEEECVHNPSNDIERSAFGHSDLFCGFFHVETSCASRVIWRRSQEETETSVGHICYPEDLENFVDAKLYYGMALNSCESRGKQSVEPDHACHSLDTSLAVALLECSEAVVGEEDLDTHVLDNECRGLHDFMQCVSKSELHCLEGMLEVNLDEARPILSEILNVDPSCFGSVCPDLAEVVTIANQSCSHKRDEFYTSTDDDTCMLFDALVNCAYDNIHDDFSDCEKEKMENMLYSRYREFLLQLDVFIPYDIDIQQCRVEAKPCPEIGAAADFALGNCSHLIDELHNPKAEYYTICWAFGELMQCAANGFYQVAHYDCDFETFFYENSDEFLNLLAVELGFPASQCKGKYPCTEDDVISEAISKCLEKYPNNDANTEEIACAFDTFSMSEFDCRQTFHVASCVNDEIRQTYRTRCYDSNFPMTVFQYLQEAEGLTDETINEALECCSVYKPICTSDYLYNIWSNEGSNMTEGCLYCSRFASGLHSPDTMCGSLKDLAMCIGIKASSNGEDCSFDTVMRFILDDPFHMEIYNFQPGLCFINPRCNRYHEWGQCDSTWTEKYYFDIHSMTCMPFDYGDCGGNDNRFDSERECAEECIVDSDCPSGLPLLDCPGAEVSTANTDQCCPADTRQALSWQLGIDVPPKDELCGSPEITAFIRKTCLVFDKHAFYETYQKFTEDDYTCILDFGLQSFAMNSVEEYGHCTESDFANGLDDEQCTERFNTETDSCWRNLVRNFYQHSTEGCLLPLLGVFRRDGTPTAADCVSVSLAVGCLQNSVQPSDVCDTSVLIETMWQGLEITLSTQDMLEGRPPSPDYESKLEILKQCAAGPLPDDICQQTDLLAQLAVDSCRNVIEQNLHDSDDLPDSVKALIACRSLPEFRGCSQDRVSHMTNCQGVDIIRAMYNSSVIENEFPYLLLSTCDNPCHETVLSEGVLEDTQSCFSLLPSLPYLLDSLGTSISFCDVNQFIWSCMENAIGNNCLPDIDWNGYLMYRAYSHHVDVTGEIKCSGCGTPRTLPYGACDSISHRQMMVIGFEHCQYFFYGSVCGTTMGPRKCLKENLPSFLSCVPSTQDLQAVVIDLHKLLAKSPPTDLSCVTGTKQGNCPATSTGYYGTCELNADCYDDLICCNEQCEPPEYDDQTRFGECPNSIPTTDVQSSPCTDDSACSDTTKCCEGDSGSGTGPVCTKPIENDPHPGFCPVVPKDTEEVHCLESCSVDNHCGSYYDKCCPTSNGCGKQCKYRVDNPCYDSGYLRKAFDSCSSTTTSSIDIFKSAPNTEGDHVVYEWSRERCRTFNELRECVIDKLHSETGWYCNHWEIDHSVLDLLNQELNIAVYDAYVCNENTPVCSSAYLQDHMDNCRWETDVPCSSIKGCMKYAFFLNCLLGDVSKRDDTVCRIEDLHNLILRYELKPKLRGVVPSDCQIDEITLDPEAVCADLDIYRRLAERCLSIVGSSCSNYSASRLCVDHALKKLGVSCPASSLSGTAWASGFYTEKGMDASTIDECEQFLASLTPCESSVLMALDSESMANCWVILSSVNDFSQFCSAYTETLMCIGRTAQNRADEEVSCIPKDIDSVTRKIMEEYGDESVDVSVFDICLPDINAIDNLESGCKNETSIFRVSNLMCTEAESNLWENVENLSRCRFAYELGLCVHPQLLRLGHQCEFFDMYLALLPALPYYRESLGQPNPHDIDFQTQCLYEGECFIALYGSDTCLHNLQSLVTSTGEPFEPCRLYGLASNCVTGLPDWCPGEYVGQYIGEVWEEDVGECLEPDDPCEDVEVLLVVVRSHCDNNGDYNLETLSGCWWSTMTLMCFQEALGMLNMNNAECDLDHLIHQYDPIKAPECLESLG